MVDILQVLAVLLVVVATSLALAHALELPGKMRLSKEAFTPCSPSIIRGSPLEASLSPPV